MKKMKRFIAIREKTLKCNLNVLYGHTLSEANSFLKKYGREPISKENEYVYALAFKDTDLDGTPYYSIWIPKPEWSLKYQAIIGHELTHIIFWICNDRGIDIIRDSPNETYAYLWEFFFLELCRKISKLLSYANKKTRNGRSARTIKRKNKMRHKRRKTL